MLIDRDIELFLKFSVVVQNVPSSMFIFLPDFFAIIVEISKYLKSTGCSV